MCGMCNSEKVVYQTTIFQIKIARTRRLILESKQEIENKGSWIIDILFLTHYLETKQSFRDVLEFER